MKQNLHLKGFWRKAILLAGVFLFSGGVLFLSGALSAWAQGLSDTGGLSGVISGAATGAIESSTLGGMGRVLAQILGSVIYILVIIPCSYALDLLIKLLFTVASFNNFIHASAVQIGWVIVRDLMNTIFVILLIYIAFGTILHRKEVHYREILPELVKAAILVNFSKTIAGIFIDLSQIVMLSFIKAMGTFTGPGVFFANIGITKFFSATNYSNNLGDAIALTAGILIAGAAMIALVITVGIFVLVLIRRIVILWTLVIFSPVPYVLKLVPRLKFKDWWGEFTEALITGPVLAFFLYIAVAIMSQQQAFQGDFSDAVDLNPGLKNQSKLTVSPIDLLSFIVILAILGQGLEQAAKIGGRAGKLAGEWGGKIASGDGIKELFKGYYQGTGKALTYGGAGVDVAKFGAKGVGGVASLTARGIDLVSSAFGKDTNFAGAVGKGNSFVSKVFDKVSGGVDKAIEGRSKIAGAVQGAYGQIGQRRKELADDAEKEGTAWGQQKFDQVIAGKASASQYDDFKDKQFRDKRDEYGKIDDVNDIKHKFAGLLDDKGNLKAGKEADARAIVHWMAKNGKTAELYKDANMSKFFGSVQTQTSAAEGVEKLLGKGKSEEELASIYSDLATVAGKNGDALWAGMTKVNETTGKIQFNARRTSDGQAIRANIKDAQGKVTGQRYDFQPDQARVHASLKGKNEKLMAREVSAGHIFNRDHKNKTDVLSDNGKQALIDLSGDLTKQYDQTSKEFKDAMKGNIVQIMDFANTELQGKQRDDVLKLVDRISSFGADQSQAAAAAAPSTEPLADEVAAKAAANKLNPDVEDAVDTELSALNIEADINAAAPSINFDSIKDALDATLQQAMNKSKKEITSVTTAATGEIIANAMQKAADEVKARGGSEADMRAAAKVAGKASFNGAFSESRQRADTDAVAAALQEAASSADATIKTALPSISGTDLNAIKSVIERQVRQMTLNAIDSSMNVGYSDAAEAALAKALDKLEY